MVWRITNFIFGQNSIMSIIFHNFKMEKIKEKLNNLLEQGFLISPDILEHISKEEGIVKNINNSITTQEKPLIISNELCKAVSNKVKLNINWVDFEKSRTFLEKGRDTKIYNTFLDILGYNTSEGQKHKVEHIIEEIKPSKEVIEIQKKEIIESQEKETPLPGNGNSVLVLKNYTENTKKREIQDFVSYFKVRYEGLKKILMNRPELQTAVSINRLGNGGREKVALIGIVADKNKTKNENLILSMEDPTGKINILINKNKPELYSLAEDIVLDEVIGITGVINEKIIFVDNILFPDIQEIKLKKSDDEAYAIFTSDIHLGLHNFLGEDFTNFIKWLNLDYGNNELKDLAKKVKYLFLVGDLVDGVGIYPGQEKDLVIKEIYEQYSILAGYLNKIPKSIKIIICAGNHDALRLSEPQPVLDKKIAKPIHDMGNVTFVTNPSLVNIHASRDFSGFNILLYHGFSMPYYAEAVNSIRVAGGQDRADLIMKFYLQRRHLAPTHSSNLYIPDPEQDPLLIDKVPDFLVTGHIHKVSTFNYKGVTCLNCSCWASKTEEQERRGINPDPSKVILANLKTREIKILNFGK